MGAWEYRLWMAKDEIEGLVRARMERTKGLSEAQALEQVQADFRVTRARKANR